MNELPDWRQACEHLEHELYLQLTGQKPLTTKATKMKIDEAFPSKYLKATDLQGKRLKVTIESVTRITEGDGDLKGKFEIGFIGKGKKMILNKTNGYRIADKFGEEMDDWPGHEVVLYSEIVDFKGTPTESLRVLPHQEVEDDDSVPF